MLILNEREAERFHQRGLSHVVLAHDNVEARSERDFRRRVEALVVLNFEARDIHDPPLLYRILGLTNARKLTAPDVPRPARMSSRSDPFEKSCLSPSAYWGASGCDPFRKQFQEGVCRGKFNILQ